VADGFLAAGDGLAENWLANAMAKSGAASGSKQHDNK